MEFLYTLLYEIQWTGRTKDLSVGRSQDELTAKILGCSNVRSLPEVCPHAEQRVTGLPGSEYNLGASGKDCIPFNYLSVFLSYNSAGIRPQGFAKVIGQT